MAHIDGSGRTILPKTRQARTKTTKTSQDTDMTRTPHASETQTAPMPLLPQGGETAFGPFDDRELEHALKTVGTNPRDLVQFLRSTRAQ